MYTMKENNTYIVSIRSTSQICRQLVLTLIPSQRDTALKGLKARRVLIDLNAGISAAPAQIAAKFTNDNYNDNIIASKNVHKNRDEELR